MSNKSGSLINKTNDLFTAFNNYFIFGNAGLEQNNIATGHGYVVMAELLDIRVAVCTCSHRSHEPS
jgi:hypothetical protein